MTNDFYAKYDSEHKKISLVFFSHWINCSNVEQFIKICRADKSLYGSQPWAELHIEGKYNIEIDFPADYFENWGDLETFSYFTDAGSVKLGNQEISCSFPNGYGDGEFLAVVAQGHSGPREAREITSGFNLVGEMRGAFDLYQSDTDDLVLKSFKGRFFIWSRSGTVIIAQIS